MDRASLQIIYMVEVGYVEVILNTECQAEKI